MLVDTLQHLHVARLCKRTPTNTGLPGRVMQTGRLCHLPGMQRGGCGYGRLSQRRDGIDGAAAMALARQSRP